MPNFLSFLTVNLIATRKTPIALLSLSFAPIAVSFILLEKPPEKMKCNKILKQTFNTHQVRGGSLASV